MNCGYGTLLYKQSCVTGHKSIELNSNLVIVKQTVQFLWYNICASYSRLWEYADNVSYCTAYWQPSLDPALPHWLAAVVYPVINIQLKRVSRLPMDNKGCWSEFFTGVMPFFSPNHLFNCQSHPTQSASMGQSGRSHRLPQPGQLTIRAELLGYHNNNNHQCQNTERLWT